VKRGKRRRRLSHDETANRPASPAPRRKKRRRKVAVAYISNPYADMHRIYGREARRVQPRLSYCLRRAERVGALKHRRKWLREAEEIRAGLRKFQGRLIAELERGGRKL
jgi:hypothetical protein